MSDAGIATTVYGGLGLVLAVAAVVLLRLGRWPRRRGDTPHCRGCGYVLVGNESGRCPECGGELTPQNTVLGERPRRPRVEAAGWVACAAAVLLLAAVAWEQGRGVDWYRYRPAAWVVKDAASADFIKSQRAWDELGRRGREKQLPAGAEKDWLALVARDASSGDRARAKRAWEELATRRDALPAEVEQSLIEAALLEQAKPPEAAGPLRQEMVEYLAGRYLAGRLTPAQVQRFFDQAITVKLRVRPVVALGDEVPYYLDAHGTGPSGSSDGGWSYKIEYLGVWVDGEKVHGGGGSSSGSGLSAGGGMGSWVRVRTKGSHTLEARALIKVYRGPLEGGQELHHRREVTLKAPFNVDDRPPDEHVKWIDRPELQAAMQAAIRPDRFGYPYGERGPDPYFYSGVDVSNAAENIAFEVFARAGNREYPLGTVALRKGKSSGIGLDGGVLKGVEADRVDLVLRASKKAARRTVDLYDVWRGELVIPGVKIERTATPQPAGTRPSAT